MKQARNLDISVITDLHHLQHLAPEWSDLWGRSPHAYPFQRPHWLLPWVQAFRPQDIWAVAVRHDQRLVGLAPMFIYRREGERVLVPLGAGVSDYLDWLIDGAMRDQVICCILTFLDKNHASFDQVEIFDVPKTSALLNFSSTLSSAAQVGQYDTCAVLRWNGELQDPAPVLTRHQRRNLRTARNRSERLGKVTIELANQFTRPEFLDALLRLHRARWAQRKMPGVLADRAVQQFHRAVTQALEDSGVLRLYAVRLDDIIIAVLYAMAEQDTLYCYLQGFDPRYSELSPGAQIMAAAIEDAIREGKCAVDFLRGRETYKYAWGAKDEPTYRVTFRCLGDGMLVPDVAQAA